MAERCPTGRRTVHAAPAPHTMQSANLRLTAVERAHPFSKAHCRLPRRRPKPDSFTGRLRRRGSFCFSPPKPKRLLRGQSQSRAARRLPFALCIRRSARGREPPFPPGGRNQFWLIRYTVRNRRQKAASLGHHSAKDIGRPKAGHFCKAKYPFMANLTLPKAARLREKNTRL